jgi:hypothetical protein
MAVSVEGMRGLTEVDEQVVQTAADLPVVVVPSWENQGWGT